MFRGGIRFLFMAKSPTYQSDTAPQSRDKAVPKSRSPEPSSMARRDWALEAWAWASWHYLDHVDEACAMSGDAYHDFFQYLSPLQKSR